MLEGFHHNGTGDMEVAKESRVEAETAYVPENPTEMVGQYLRATLKKYRMMDDFLCTQFFQHPEVDPYITF